MLTRALAALTGVVVAGTLLLGPGPAPAAPAAARAGVPQTLGTAQAIRHYGRWLVDPQGRVLQPHGLNIISKTAPYYPTVFSAQDARFLASEGFTAARIGFIWAGVEPKPGVYDDAYIRRIAALNTLLGRYGIRTLIDFHQDAYSAKYGGDGAPEWASQDDGLCTVPQACAFAPAVQAFQHFWDDDPAPDGVGLQTHFLRAWRHIVPFLRDSPNILGYDILNEPYAGTRSACVPFGPCPSFEEGALASFYRRATAAIRSRDTEHLVFYEPVPQLLGEQTFLPASLSPDPRLGFTYHFYARDCGSPPTPTDPVTTQLQQAHCALEEGAAILAGVGYARKAGTAVFMGEWGDSDNTVDVAQMNDLMTGRFVPWTEWQYNTTLASSAPGLLIDDSKPGSEANARQGRLDALTAPYAPVIAGTPLAWSWDRSTGVMSLAFSTHAASRRGLAPGARTMLFMPRRHYRQGFGITVHGARIVARDTQHVWLVSLPSASRVSVRVVPRT